MKKSVSELKRDLASANKQIKIAKKSGNKRALNLGRQKRLSTWRILRDEHGMEPPSHVAKALGTPKKEPARKTPTEFTKPKENLKGTVMDFTKFASKAEKRRFFADQKRAMGGIAVARKVDMPKKKARPGEMRAQVRAWLSKDIEYLRLVRKIFKHNDLADKASKEAKRLGPKKSEAVLNSLDTLFFNRHTAIATEGELKRLLKKKEVQFKKEFASNSALVKSYSTDLGKFSEVHGTKVVLPFNSSERKLMDKIAYNYHERRDSKGNVRVKAKTQVKGKNRLEEEMKRVLLEKAQDLIEGLEDPTPEEKNTMREIQKAASNPSVNSSKMLRVAVGRKKLTEDEASSIELALVGETVDKLETRVAMAAERKKPVRVASRGSRKEKRGKPVKVASLTRSKRGKKRV